MASVATLRDIVGALVDIGLQENKLEKITEDLEKFFSVIDQYDYLKNIFSTSVYGIGERKDILMDISKEVSLDSYTVNFINTVIEIDRFKYMIESQEPILRRLRDASGKVKAQVIFAKDPTGEDIDVIRKSIEQKLGRQVDLDIEVDPRILGGVIVKVSNNLFDNSIKTQLNNMKNILTAI